MLNSHMWLMATILDGADTERSHHCRQSYWAALPECMYLLAARWLSCLLRALLQQGLGVGEGNFEADVEVCE